MFKVDQTSIRTDTAMKAECYEALDMQSTTKCDYYDVMRLICADFTELGRTCTIHRLISSYSDAT